jgi:hypothetical protein
MKHSELMLKKVKIRYSLSVKTQQTEKTEKT